MKTTVQLRERIRQLGEQLCTISEGATLGEFQNVANSLNEAVAELRTIHKINRVSFDFRGNIP